jgi:ribose transport system permease protein
MKLLMPSIDSNLWKRIKTSVFGNPGVAIWLVVVALLLVARLISAGFWDPTHLLNVLRQASGLGILTLGQTMVILTGGIDLSNGMVITLVDVLAAGILNGKDNLLIPVILLTLGLGLFIGLINGLLITKVKIPPLVCTLGMFSILKGIAYMYTGGAPKGAISPSLQFVGEGFIGPIPTQVFFLIGFFILIYVLIHRTPYGRKIYAVGGNKRAAHLSGVNPDRIIISVYMVSSILAALTGLILAGYIGTGSLNIGDGLNFNSVAAAVVGGTLFSGGIGSVFGGMGGALFLAILISMLRFLGLPYQNQLMVQGAILAIAIYAQTHSKE